MRTSAGPSKTLGPAASPVGEKVANQTGSAVGTRDGERAAAAANTRRISGTTPRGKATCRGSHRVARRLYEPQRPVYTERRCLDDGVMHTRAVGHPGSPSGAARGASGRSRQAARPGGSRRFSPWALVSQCAPVVVLLPNVRVRSVRPFVCQASRN